MIKPASRKTMVSTTKNIENMLPSRSTQKRKVFCTLYTNLRLEEKTGSFNVTQVSRIATKDQNFNLEAR